MYIGTVGTYGSTDTYIVIMFFLGDIPNLKMAARQKPRNKSGKCVKFIVGHTDTFAIFHVTNLLPMYVSPAIAVTVLPNFSNKLLKMYCRYALATSDQLRMFFWPSDKGFLWLLCAIPVTFKSELITAKQILMPIQMISMGIRL